MRTIRILTLGNSFSGNALRYLKRIAEGTDAVRFEVGQADLGGCSLEKHWNLSKYTEKQPELKTYNLWKNDDGTSVEMNLQESLVAKPWDIIVLQQVSQGSWRRETFEPWLEQLHDMVSVVAPQARIMLHQTWAYRTDSPYLTENCMTQEVMHNRIHDNYQYYADKYNCVILPSGDAVNNARQAPGCKYLWPDTEYDFQHPVAPLLPKQENSFAVGWHWKFTQAANGIPELALDTNHLNARGCYLSSAVWFEAMAGISIHDSQYTPDDLALSDVEFLRDIAHLTPKK